LNSNENFSMHPQFLVWYLTFGAQFKAADRKSRQDGRKNARRSADSPAGSPLRRLVRQPAADDGGHTENPHGTA
jgi:hypothetical protein